MPEQIWRLHLGQGPLVALAIHDGHDVREELLAQMVLAEAERLREEDPHTQRWTTVAPTRVVGTRSRFEVDLNRPRAQAVYRTPEDAWGLRVWSGQLPDALAERSLEEYDAFYQMLEEVYQELLSQHDRLVVYDLHSYNHYRGGPDGPPAPEAGNPQVNVGTGTMADRSLWAPVIDRFVADLSAVDFPGGKLDVRENVRFFGGHCARWTHAAFPDKVCVLSIEWKKFFMDEWTGVADMELVDAIGQALQQTVAGVCEELERLR